MQFVVLAVLVAVATAELYQAPGPTQIPDPAPAAFAALIASAPSANEASLNEANARRQHKVNYQALHYGAGVGTALYYGVPGTALEEQHNADYHNTVYSGSYNRGYGHGYSGAHNGAHAHGYNVPYAHTFHGAHAYHGTYY